MGSLLRVKLRWSGFIGSPGYSVFHFMDTAGSGTLAQNATEAATLLNSFASQVAAQLPAAGNLQVMSDVEEIQEATGEMLNIVNAGSFAVQNGQGTAGEAFAGPVGAVVNWRTAGVRHGRRVHGRTFLVPLRSSAFESNGSLSPTAVSGLSTAAASLVTGSFDAPNVGVYCRPTSPGNTDGIFHTATASNVPDLAAVLRSRRD